MHLISVSPLATEPVVPVMPPIQRDFKVDVRLSGAELVAIRLAIGSLNDEKIIKYLEQHVPCTTPSYYTEYFKKHIDTLDLFNTLTATLNDMFRSYDKKWKGFGEHEAR